MLIQSGVTANKNGSTLEKTVESLFAQRGFDIVQNREYIKNDTKKQPTVYSPNLVLKNTPYDSMYGHVARSEYVVKSLVYPDLKIECRWQQVSGSVDEKFPYLYLNSLRSTEDNIILLIDGDGYKYEALEWLKYVVSNKLQLGTNVPHTKNIQVMNLSEFVIFFNNTY